MSGGRAERVETVRRRGHTHVRELILAEAWRLADEAGIAGLTLRELARRVGMQAPSLYTYFGSKDALFDAMFREGYEALDRAQTEWAGAVEGMDTVDALARSLEWWIDFCQESIARYQLMFTRAIPGWSPSAEAYIASSRQFERMKAALAAVGVEGEEQLALFMALSAGLVAQQLANDPDGDSWKSLAPVAADMFVRYGRNR
jgi:AcrR family transcriptional regulator